MKLCKYCNTAMMSEYETKHDGSCFEFHNCPKCYAVYECISKEKGRGREKYTEHRNERWWNPTKNEWE